MGYNIGYGHFPTPMSKLSFSTAKPLGGPSEAILDEDCAQ